MAEEETDERILPFVVKISPLNPASELDRALISRRLTRCLPKWPPKIDLTCAKASLTIEGIEVLFPEVAPFHTQINMMKHMIASFKASKHALLESPTGTGKSLALLCAAIAFQVHQYKEKARVPRVIVASRTHSQLKSLCNELRRSPYRPFTVTLGSRLRFCPNPDRNGEFSSTSDFCADALSGRKCSFGLKIGDAHHVDTVSQICKGECDNVVFDIEEMTGTCGDACPYYTSNELASRCHLVFVPYNYVIDPTISSRLDLMSNSIVIVDEAHNILDIAMDAASATLEKFQLPDIILACDKLSDQHQKLVDYVKTDRFNSETSERVTAMRSIKPVRILASKLNACLRQLQNIAERSSQEEQHHWAGDFEYASWATSPPASTSSIRSALQGFGITENLCSLAHEVRRSWSDAIDLLHERFRMLLRNLNPLFDFLKRCSRAWRDSSAFRLLFVRTYKFSSQSWVSSLRLLCLTAEIVINQQCDIVKSFLVSSGTLSPVPEFCQDLGDAFNARLLSKLQNGHVIDCTQQLLFGTLGVGCTAEKLSGTMKGQSRSYYRGVGDVIQQVCECVPFGVLVFVSSYRAIEKFMIEWKRSGSWQTITKLKGTPFLEPSQCSDDEFQMVCNRFRASAVTGNGAILIAVYRGKASEGISFSNDVCRACICVSLPLPCFVDLRIQAKIEHDNRVAGNGRQWYEQQAYRAVNQALGRVIRHAGDYGLLLLLDDRFATKSNRDISAWLWKHMRNFVSVVDLCQQTKRFFDEVETRKPFKYINPQANSSDLKFFEADPRHQINTDKKRKNDTNPIIELTQDSFGSSPDASSFGSEPYCTVPSQRTAYYRIAYEQLMFDE